MVSILIKNKARAAVKAKEMPKKISPLFRISLMKKKPIGIELKPVDMRARSERILKTLITDEIMTKTAEQIRKDGEYIKKLEQLEKDGKIDLIAITKQMARRHGVEFVKDMPDGRERDLARQLGTIHSWAMMDEKHRLKKEFDKAL